MNLQNGVLKVPVEKLKVIQKDARKFCREEKSFSKKNEPNFGIFQILPAGHAFSESHHRQHAPLHQIAPKPGMGLRSPSSMWPVPRGHEIENPAAPAEIKTFPKIRKSVFQGNTCRQQHFCLVLKKKPGKPGDALLATSVPGAHQSQGASSSRAFNKITSRAR
jgi:hypothetical protein